jgi:hypothetical protein
MLTFTTGLVMILSSVSGNQAAAVTTSVVEPSAVVETTDNMVLTADDSILTQNSTQTARSSKKVTAVETYVRAYFAKTPVLAEIAFCESRFTHYTISGNVLRGRITPEDVGVMQINEYYHEKTAAKLGINLETLDGNLAYAKYLYETQGTQPWSASAACWKK